MPLKENDSKIKYVFNYCEKHLSCLMPDDFTGELYMHYSVVPDRYMYYYNDIIAALPKHFNETEYYKFKCLQKQIEYFNLDKEAFWGFLVFLYHAADVFLKRKGISYGEKIKEINQFIKKSASSDNGLKITLTSGRKKIEITDSVLMTAILSTFNCPDDYWQNIMVKGLHCEPVTGYTTVPIKLKDCEYTWKEPEEATERKKSYFVIKTIADELIHDRPEGVTYTNQEKILYLCILYLCQYLIGDTTKEYTYKNVAPVSQLLKDFEGTETFNGSLETAFY